MATQTLTSTPAEITGLTADTWYTVQNRGNESFYIQTATSNPSKDESFVVAPFAMIQIKVTGTQKIYVSQDDIRGDRSFGTLIIEPSA